MCERSMIFGLLYMHFWNEDFTIIITGMSLFTDLYRVWAGRNFSTPFHNFALASVFVWLSIGHAFGQPKSNQTQVDAQY